MGDVDAVVTGDEEKTFQYQNSLPSLPVPHLNETLRRYLDSVRPHVTDGEYRQTEELCRQFEAGDGKELHEKLLQKVKRERNWLEYWWEQGGYMEVRLPAPLMNMTGPGPYVFDIWKPKMGTQIFRAAMMVYFTVRYWQFVKSEKIRPLRDGRRKLQCMLQFRRMFNTCKVPGVHADRLLYYFQTETEGPVPSYIVVMYKGHFFTLECLDGEGNSLTIPEFESQLQNIYDRVNRMGAAPALGYFTTLERTAWAKIRSRLVALHPENYSSLEKIQKSVVVIGLDDDCPVDIDDLTWKGMFGDPHNKWFDKSMNFVAYRNGTIITNCDHSPMEGVMLMYCTHYAHTKILECNGQWTGTKVVRKLPEPDYVKFHLNDSLLTSLQEAKLLFAKLARSVELKLYRFMEYGKDYLKIRKIHPDTHCQMAFQLTYYRMYKKFAPTYETATIRQYYHGRTETVRSCTVESAAWCKSMADPARTESDRLRLFKIAVNKHNNLMEEATNLQGCDRHLYGLAMLAREEGRPLPQIYMDPSFVKSGGGGHYILSTSCIGYTSVCGGVAPMCPHGYGTFYCINNDKIRFFVTAWTEDEDTSVELYCKELHRALCDMKSLLDIQDTKPQARL